MNSIKFYFLLIVMFAFNNCFSQGDGPHSFMLAPKNVSGVNAKWLNLTQNIDPSLVFVPGVDVKVDAFPITLFHTFSLKGRFAQIYFMFSPTQVQASAKSLPSQLLNFKDLNTINSNGFSDGFLGFRLGLLGAPALNVPDFLKNEMKFSLFADVRTWYSGTYDPSKIVNTGSNIYTFQFSLPMSIPLNKNRAKATWLEVSPSIDFYTANNQPARFSRTDKVTQAPAFIIENHLSHYFNKKFWGVLDLRYRTGGQTSSDGKKDGNSLRILGAGIGAGYQLLPYLGLSADYGDILYGYNGAESKMLRFCMTFNYVNLKKNK
jgi:hypothetical protein